MRLFTFSLVLFLSFFLVFGAGVTAAQAQEVIERYDVDIAVDAKGGIAVHERIRVFATGGQIRRGIYRDWPATARGFLGSKLVTAYNITDVRRDGVSEPYHTQFMGNSLRLYIGDAATYLTPHQSYTYDIRYYVPDQIDYYDEFDELYWNAIGTEWIFPINEAHVTVRFPDGARIKQYSVYTGAKGSQGTNFIANVDGGVLDITTKRTLSPYNGMTFAAAIPKGFVSQPKMNFLSRFNRAHPGFFIVLFGLIVTVYWVHRVWQRSGKDPLSRGNAPFYTPPESISPTEAAFIKSRGRTYGRQLLPITLIAIASKGFIHINRDKKGRYTIDDTGENLNTAKLSVEEQKAYNFVKGGYTVKSHDYNMISLASLIYRTIEKACKGRYYKGNTGAWMLSLLPMFLTVGILPLAVPLLPLMHIVTFYLIFLAVFVCLLPFGKLMYKIFTGTWYLFFKVLSGAVCLVALALVSAFIGEVSVNLNTSYLVIFVGLIMAFVCAYAQPLMETLTPKGREIMDHLNGLELYMSAVEEKVLQKFDPPEMSRELYEELFPYAVALGIESKWGDKFVAGMATATVAGVVAAADTINRTPHWFDTSDNSDFGGGFDMSSFVSDFASNVRAAATSQSTSSSGGGSSGGGSSGGGGW